MNDLLDAGLVNAPSTALDSPPLPQRPNQLFQGVLAFLAVVGIGSTVTVILHPPLRLRVITVEKRLPAPEPAAPRIALARPQQEAPMVAPRRDPRTPRTTPRTPATRPIDSKPLLKSDDCKNDPLCGLGDLKQ